MKKVIAIMMIAVLSIQTFSPFSFVVFASDEATAPEASTEASAESSSETQSSEQASDSAQKDEKSDASSQETQDDDTEKAETAEQTDTQNTSASETSSEDTSAEDTSSDETLVSNGKSSENTSDTENAETSSDENTTDKTHQTSDETPTTSNNASEAIFEGGGDDKPSEDEASEALTPMMMRAPLLTSSEGKVNLKIATTELDAAGNPKTEYYAGGQIGTYATIEPSGNGFKLINPKIKITFPKKYVLSQPTFPQPESATSVKITQDVDNWYTTYSFDQLVGGKRIDIPLFFQMISNHNTASTPDDFETKIKMELFDESGDLLNETSTTYITKNYKNIADAFQRGNILTYPRTLDEHGDRIYYTDLSIYDRGDTHTAQGAGAPWMRLAIRVLSTGEDMKAAPLGRYLPKTLKIDVQLPPGAVLGGTLQDSGLYSGKYLQTYGNWEIPWSYDPTTHIATYSGAVYGNERHVPLLTTYPDLPYTGADGKLSVHKSIITITQDPDTDHELVLDPVTVGVKYNPVLRNYDDYLAFYQQGYQLYDGIAYETAEHEKLMPYSYRLSIQDGRNGDTGREKFYLYELLDYDLDPHLYYKGIRLTNWDGVQSTKNFTIYGVKEDNSEVPLGTSLQTGTYLEINDTAGEYKKLKITFDEPVLLNSSRVIFDVLAGIKDDMRSDLETNFLVDKKVPNWVAVERNQKLFKNHAKLTYSNVKTPNDKKEKNNRGRLYFVRDYSRLYVLNHSNNHTVSPSKNNQRSIGFRASLAKGNGMQWTEYGKQNIVAKGIKLLYLLPPGIEYVPGTVQFEDKNAPSVLTGLTIGEPQVIANYQKSGKTALIFDLGDLRRGREYEARGGEVYGKWLNSRVFFNIDVTKYTAIGQNIIELYEIGDRSQDVDVFAYDRNKAVPDTGDYDNDGDTTDTIRDSGKITINYVPAREILLKNTLSNDTTDGFVNGSIFDQGEDAFYKMGIFNNALVPISNLSMIHVLPTPGDHAIVANKNGDYLPRGSQFVVGLSGSLEAMPENQALLADWQILYSLDEQGADIEATKQANFLPKDQITDFSKVKMIKIVQKPGSKLQEGATADFIIPAYVPNKSTGGKLLTAIGSSAFSTNGHDYIEGNQTKFQLIDSYRVDGKVFVDLDQDGALSGEAGLVGYDLALMNADGTPALDAKGNPITTQTDQSGNYQIDILKRGQYYLTLKKKVATDKETKLYEENGVVVVGSGGNDASLDTDDATEMTLKSPVFTLNPFSISSPDNVLQKPSSMIATRNFGLILSNGKINIKLVDAEDENKVLSGAVFQIEDENGLLIGSFTSDKNGQIQTDFLPFGAYTIKQIKATPKYDVNPSVLKVNLNTQLLSAQMKNKKSRGNLTFFAFHQQDHNTVMSGVQFQLKDEQGNLIETLTTDTRGLATSSSLVYGKYFLTQIREPKEYQLENPTIAPIVLDSASEKVSLPYVKKRAALAIKAMDAKRNRGLDGATFEVYDGRNLVATISSDQYGNALTPTLPRGNYLVKEITSPRGYRLNTDTFTLDLSGSVANLIFDHKKKSNPEQNPTPTPIQPIQPETPIIDIVPIIPVLPKPEVNPPIQEDKIDKNSDGGFERPHVIDAVLEPDPIVYREKGQITLSQNDTQKNATTSQKANKINKYVKVLPKTGVGEASTLIKRAGIISKKARKTIETALPSKETFKFAGSSTTSLQDWIQVLPKQDRNADKYLILPTQGLIIPINTVEEGTQAYDNFTNGITEDFATYLHDGAVELPGTSINTYGMTGNKVVIGHSSYRKKSSARYKTHFQEIIAMDEGEEVWVFQKNPTTKSYEKFSYTVVASYNTKPDDISVLYPSEKDQITLITCTPIGGIAGRWIVKAVAKH